jgi:HSP20 family protein
MRFQYLPARQAVDQLRGEMNRLLSGAMENFGSPWLSGARGQPAVNAWEKPDGFVVEMEVPGIKQEQLDISVVDNELTIKLERPEVEEPQVTFHRRERPTGNFARVLRLPAAVDGGRVAATLRNGVLTIELPKAESAKPRKINIVAS